MQAEAGEAAKEDPDRQSTDIDPWFGDHLNPICNYMSVCSHILLL